MTEPIPETWMVVPPDGEEYPPAVIEVRKALGEVQAIVVVETEYPTVADLRRLWEAVRLCGGR